MKRFLSSIICLVLVLALVPMQAKAGDAPRSPVNYNDISGENYTDFDYNVAYIRENYASISYNLPGKVVDYMPFNTDTAIIETNRGSVMQNGDPDISDEDNSNSIIVYNEGSIVCNFGTVSNNCDYLGANLGEVGINQGTVNDNRGLINTNDSQGYVRNMDEGLIKENYGTVHNKIGGIIMTNMGTVFNDGGHVMTNKGYDSRVYERLTVNGPIEIDFINSESGESGLLLNDEGLWLLRGGYDMLITPTGDYKLKDLDIAVSFSGDGSATATPDASHKLQLNSGAITVTATPKPASTPTPASLVPATGDDSNMPLWTALLLLFAVSALLSRRKKA